MLVIVDVEASGPIPPDYSMIELGAVAIMPDETFRTFGVLVKPLNDRFVPSALEAIGQDWNEVLKRDAAEPDEAMLNFKDWIAIMKAQAGGHAIFMSDNTAFDWQFVNYYFHHYTGSNPFGYSGRRIGDLYCGLTKDFFGRWKHLRKTPHTHNSIDDAMGNAEAMIALKHKYGLKIKF